MIHAIIKAPSSNSALPLKHHAGRELLTGLTLQVLGGRVSRHSTAPVATVLAHWTSDSGTSTECSQYNMPHPCSQHRKAHFKGPDQTAEQDAYSPNCVKMAAVSRPIFTE